MGPTNRRLVLISGAADLQEGNWETEECCFLTSETTLVKHMEPIRKLSWSRWGGFMNSELYHILGLKIEKRKDRIHLGGFEC